MAQLQTVERKRIKNLQAAEHRIATEIVRNHELIAVEDTAISNMTRSAKNWNTSPAGMEDSSQEYQPSTRTKPAQPAEM